MESDKFIEDIFKEISVALKAMAKTKSPEEKLTHSRIVKNLCGSLGAFLNLTDEMEDYGENGPF